MSTIFPLLLVPLQRCISARGSRGAVPRRRSKKHQHTQAHPGGEGEGGAGPKRTISSQEDPWHKDTLFNGVVGDRNQKTPFSPTYWRPATKKRFFFAKVFLSQTHFFRPIRTVIFQTHQKQNRVTLLPPCAPVWMFIGQWSLDELSSKPHPASCCSTEASSRCC